MRTVRLHRPAFINGCLCDAGSTVTISDETALAPFMTLVVPDAPIVSPAPQTHTVSVQYNERAGEVDIVVDGVETKLDHAALKLRMD